MPSKASPLTDIRQSMSFHADLAFKLISLPEIALTPNDGAPKAS
jgi:hypothetical protein